ncbi:hypothetical protein B0H16DRAFT_1468010 [Mycena metata]|uniref:Uncharacterized protein n=1 Tax=Mycena metata TaxID=1033252 RepID=A0AAD7I2J6_9AGAR|nr:hypothetical protein B0H16DRAFT_1468010 [Mycena metata]
MSHGWPGFILLYFWRRKPSEPEARAYQWRGRKSELPEYLIPEEFELFTYLCQRLSVGWAWAGRKVLDFVLGSPFDGGNRDGDGDGIEGIRVLVGVIPRVVVSMSLRVEGWSIHPRTEVMPHYDTEFAGRERGLESAGELARRDGVESLFCHGIWEENEGTTIYSQSTSVSAVRSIESEGFAGGHTGRGYAGEVGNLKEGASKKSKKGPSSALHQLEYIAGQPTTCKWAKAHSTEGLRITNLTCDDGPPSTHESSRRARTKHTKRPIYPSPYPRAPAPASLRRTPSIHPTEPSSPRLPADAYLPASVNPPAYPFLSIRHESKNKSAGVDVPVGDEELRAFFSSGASLCGRRRVSVSGRTVTLLAPPAVDHSLPTPTYAYLRQHRRRASIRTHGDEGARVRRDDADEGLLVWVAAARWRSGCVRDAGGCRRWIVIPTPESGTLRRRRGAPAFPGPGSRCRSRPPRNRALAVSGCTTRVFGTATRCGSCVDADEGEGVLVLVSACVRISVDRGGSHDGDAVGDMDGQENLCAKWQSGTTARREMVHPRATSLALADTGNWVQERERETVVSVSACGVWEPRREYGRRSQALVGAPARKVAAHDRAVRLVYGGGDLASALTEDDASLHPRPTKLHHHRRYYYYHRRPTTLPAHNEKQGKEARAFDFRLLVPPPPPPLPLTLPALAPPSTARPSPRPTLHPHRENLFLRGARSPLPWIRLAPPPLPPTTAAAADVTHPHPPVSAPHPARDSFKRKGTENLKLGDPSSGGDGDAEVGTVEAGVDGLRATAGEREGGAPRRGVCGLRGAVRCGVCDVARCDCFGSLGLRENGHRATLLLYPSSSTRRKTRSSALACQILEGWSIVAPVPAGSRWWRACRWACGGYERRGRCVASRRWRWRSGLAVVRGGCRGHRHLDSLGRTGDVRARVMGRREGSAKWVCLRTGWDVDADAWTREAGRLFFNNNANTTTMPALSFLEMAGWDGPLPTASRQPSQHRTNVDHLARRSRWSGAKGRAGGTNCSVGGEMSSGRRGCREMQAGSMCGAVVVADGELYRAATETVGMRLGGEKASPSFVLVLFSRARVKGLGHLRSGCGRGPASDLIVLLVALLCSYSSFFLPLTHFRPINPKAEARSWRPLGVFVPRRLLAGMWGVELSTGSLRFEGLDGSRCAWDTRAFGRHARGAESVSVHNFCVVQSSRRRSLRAGDPVWNTTRAFDDTNLQQCHGVAWGSLFLQRFLGLGINVVIRVCLYQQIRRSPNNGAITTTLYKASCIPESILVVSKLIAPSQRLQKIPCSADTSGHNNVIVATIDKVFPNPSTSLPPDSSWRVPQWVTPTKQPSEPWTLRLPFASVLRACSRGNDKFLADTIDYNKSEASIRSTNTAPPHTHTHTRPSSPVDEIEISSFPSDYAANESDFGPAAPRPAAAVLPPDAAHIV